MPNERIPQLAERLKIARTRLTPAVLQREAAKAVGRSTPCIGQWESGHTEPSLSDLITLAQFYGVSLEWMLGLDAQEAYSSGVYSMEPGKTNSVPLFSSTAVVRGAQETHKHFVQASTPYEVGTAFAWKVSTDAVSQTTKSGDIAIVERHDGAENDGMYLITTDDSAAPTLRRCKMEQGAQMFVADSSIYPTLVASEVQIVGRVREVIRRIRL